MNVDAVYAPDLSHNLGSGMSIDLWGSEKCVRNLF